MKTPLKKLVMVVCAVLASGSGHADSTQQQFLRAYHAFAEKKITQGEKLSAGLENHLLYAYLQYPSLSRRLDTASSTEVRAFMNTELRSLLGEQLRTAWLKKLLKQGRAQDYVQDYRPQKERDLQCHYLSMTTAQADQPAWQELSQSLFFSGAALPSCGRAFSRLLQDLNAGQIWLGAAAAMREGNADSALLRGTRLPASEQNVLQLWRELRAKPERVIESGLGADQPALRAAITDAISVLAQKQAARANSLWQGVQSKYQFTDEERGMVTAAIALAAAKQKSDQVLELLDAIPASGHTEEVQRLMLMEGLRAADWPRLAQWTQVPPAVDMNALRWRYWRARALDLSGQKLQAQALYAELARERDYYGFLAAEQLSQPYQIPSQPFAVSAAEVDAYLRQPGIRRALELRALGLSPEARREWQFELEALDAHGITVAAQAAHQQGWYDRAILATNKAKAYDDVELRFPLPFRDAVDRYAGLRALEPAVIYGLMRQESAFAADIASSVGARGLMQLMPATARATAKGLGYKLSGLEALNYADENVKLGTAYLREMLDRFGGNIAMAAGGYNAGPHRVEKWRPRMHCMAAERWIDTIPFTETRRYVRTVLFNTVIYQQRLGQPITPLRTRMPDIPPKGVATGSCATR